MCLITEETKPFILDKDLTVKKQVSCFDENTCKPMFYHRLIYEFGVLYETEFKESTDPCAFDNLSSVAYPYVKTQPELYTIIGEGFHSMRTNRKKSHYHYDNPFVTCIIPKGSEVWKDSTGLLVSNKIIIVGPMKTKNV